MLRILQKLIVLQTFQTKLDRLRCKKHKAFKIIAGNHKIHIANLNTSDQQFTFNYFYVEVTLLATYALNYGIISYAGTRSNLNSVAFWY